MKTVQKKICLLGDFAVGKTSLVRRFVEDKFDDSYLSTIGVKISRKLECSNNKKDCYADELFYTIFQIVLRMNYLKIFILKRNVHSYCESNMHAF